MTEQATREVEVWITISAHGDLIGGFYRSEKDALDVLDRSALAHQQHLFAVKCVVSLLGKVKSLYTSTGQYVDFIEVRK